MPAMRGEAQARAETATVRRGADRRARRVRAGQRWRTRRSRATRTARSPRVAARQRRGPRRRPVPAELLVVPQLHRQGRRAVVGQVRARPGDGRARADLYRDADRSAEHAEVLRPAAVTGREARHRRLRPDGHRSARPGRVRPGRVRADVRGHGNLDHRNRGHASVWPCGSVREHDSENGHQGHGYPGPTRRSRSTDGRRTRRHVARRAGRARRQARRRRDRLQGRALAGSQHQGREARRASGGVLASAGRPFGSGAAGDLHLLAVGVQGRRHPRTHLVRPCYTAIRIDVRTVDPGHRHRRGALPEEVHSRRDLDPGSP